MPLDARKLRQSKNVPGTENRQYRSDSALKAEKGSHICYSPPLSPKGSQRASRYRLAGTTHLNLEQLINLKAAVDFARAIGLPLVAHYSIHWIGTDAGDDSDGALFAEFRETLSRWLRSREIPLAAIWVREKKSNTSWEAMRGKRVISWQTESATIARIKEFR